MPSAFSRKGSKKGGGVAAGHPATAEAGAHILKDGGNAVDAAIASVCTSFIAEPVLTGAGGGGFMLLHQGRENLLYDGFSRMPAKRMDDLFTPDFKAVPVDFGDTVQTFHVGRASVATPSLLAMLFKAHQAHGRLPMEAVLAPAMDAARSGIRLNELQASFIKLLKPILTAEDECRRVHTRNDTLLSEGDLFTNSGLANTLEMLCHEGIREMYEGDLARTIVGAVQSGGLLSMQDMAADQVYIRKPLAHDLFGGTLYTNPPPSSGGTLITFAAKLLQKLIRFYPDVPHALLIAEALRETSRTRGTDFDDQVHKADMANAFPADLFLDESRISSSLQHLRHRLDGQKMDSAAEIENRHGSTTHISVVDANGMAVSLTTSNGEGSGIVVPGTGIHLNNMLGEEDINPMGFHRLAGGTTLSSMMAPSILVKSGQPILTLGSGGSNRLRGAILQVLSRHMICHEPIEQAVHAPRLHNEGNLLDVEPGALNDEARHRLLELGWNIRDWERPSVYFGGVHAICMNEKGQLHGAGDPRRGGSVAWSE